MTPRDGPLVVGLMYPEDYEVRPRQELDDDLAALRAVAPEIEIEVIEVRYVDSYELRTQRGRLPAPTCATWPRRSPRRSTKRSAGSKSCSPSIFLSTWRPSPPTSAGCRASGPG